MSRPRGDRGEALQADARIGGRHPEHASECPRGGESSESADQAERMWRENGGLRTAGHVTHTLHRMQGECIKTGPAHTSRVQGPIPEVGIHVEAVCPKYRVRTPADRWTDKKMG